MDLLAYVWYVPVCMHIHMDVGPDVYEGARVHVETGEVDARFLHLYILREGFSQPVFMDSASVASQQSWELPVSGSALGITDGYLHLTSSYVYSSDLNSGAFHRNWTPLFTFEEGNKKGHKVKEEGT